MKTTKALLGILTITLGLAVQVQAQFTFATNNGAITITSYRGAGAVIIPSMINDLPVTSIGDGAFSICPYLTSVTIPDSITNIGDQAFQLCTSLTSVTLPDSVTHIGRVAFGHCSNLVAITVNTLNPVYSSVAGVLFNSSQTTLIECPGGKAGSYTIPSSVTTIGDWAFSWCISLTNVTIPNSVTSIGGYTFSFCTSLTNVTIGNSVTSIGNAAFYYCPSLTGVYFEGNAFSLGSILVFDGDNSVTVYCLPGTTGWGPTFGGRPTALWVLPNPLILNNGPSFGVKTNQFGFIISWATNISVVVEASTSLVNPAWSPISTNTLTSGWSYFSDRQWTNYPARFYRIRSP